MPMLIDWHAHHTPPELVEELAKLGTQAPKPDPFDSPRFARRIEEMDSAGIDMQIISQGAGLNADRFAPDVAIGIVRESNDFIAERIALFPDRLMGSIAFTWANPAASVAEIDRMADEGFKAVMMYARGDMIGREDTEPIFATIAKHNLPIFMHGGGAGSRNDPDLERFEDGGRGLATVTADATVTDCCVRMIAAGLFDRYPELQIVIRSSGGGIPLLLNKLYWKHKGPQGDEQRYSEILLKHFSVDCASSNARTLEFLMETMGDGRVVFGSDYCGGLGPLEKALPVIDDQPDPWMIRNIMEKSSRALLHI